MEDQIKNTITSAETHVKAAYDKLEEMGATMPTNKNIQNLPDTIYSLPLDVEKVKVTFDDGTTTTVEEVYPGQKVTEPIPTKEGCVFLGWYEQTEPPLPDAPSLDNPLTADQYADLQAIVAAGKAADYYNLGDTIKVPYGAYTMPFEIVGFEDVVAKVDGVEKTVPAINLLAKYTTDTSSTWGPNGTQPYKDSTLCSVIVNTYRNNLDSNFINCLSKTKIQTYSRDGTTDIYYNELFAPSMAQLGVTDPSFNTAAQAAVEGPAFTAYQGSDNAKRLKQAINATGTAQYYWTRSLYSGISSGFGVVQTSGVPDSYNYLSMFRAVAACNFVG